MVKKFEIVKNNDTACDFCGKENLRVAHSPIQLAKVIIENEADICKRCAKKAVESFGD